MPERKDFGDALVKAARAPIQAANVRLGEGAIGEGIAALSKADLLAGLRQGIENAAAVFKFRSVDVEALLPWDALLPALDRLEAAQIAALRAVQQHAIAVGGPLSGPTRGAPFDARKQTGAEALFKVSKRFATEPLISGPIELLGTEVSGWETLVSQCGDRLESSPLHARYTRRRLLVRAALVVVILGSFSVAGRSAYKTKQIENARARVDAALRAEDPCAVEKLAPEDIALAIPEQVTAEKSRLEACASGRARAKYVAACETLAKNFEAGKLSPDDLALAKEAGPRLERAQKRELGEGDLLATPKDMPCQDSPSKDRFFGTYATAAAESKKVWTEATRASDDLRDALGGKDFATKPYRDELSRRAEPAAAKAILSGKPEDMELGQKLCDFAASFGIERGKKCTGLAAVLAKKR
ncbi:hypothetical protein [Polyangium sp. y55x31]|uniref:hypothetical protein n=1 Tax=Polyangium sp. y55x31 TaxID=3042688 RepID=UPI0024831E5F|nr:hypothetical protein [Polyangium sp. y55x31]MDI1480913.1 hypothetical protein [Polyangium sp. y55x31]